MKLKVKISLADEKSEGFMGIGLVWLLRRIKKFKSINRAARDMDMSYVKALRILKRLEDNLGRKMLVRTKGGKDRGGTELTPFAERFIEEYDRFQEDVKSYSEKKFSAFRRKFELKKKERRRH